MQRKESDSLAQIAEKVGYNSEPAFNRAFKRVVGSTPGAVRKAARLAANLGDASK